MPPSRKPLLIVPIRDRRQRRRVLTIRNFAMAMLGVAVVIAAISIYSKGRRDPAAEYGRLTGEVSAPNRDLARKGGVVLEGPVADQSAPDPMLIAPAAREQLLMANSNVAPPPAVTTGSTTPASAAIVPTTVGTSSHGTTIVGDGTGVAIVHAPASSTAPPPPLSGGIFKQQ